MSKIHKLIAVEWIRFFSSAFIGLSIVLTVANLISGLLRSNVTASEVVLNHLIEFPGNMGKILPVSCLMGTLFCINKLKNRNELMAIFAAGFSRAKFISVVFILASFVGLLQLICTGYLYPYMKNKADTFIENSNIKFSNLKSQGLGASTIDSGKFWYKSDKYYFSFSTFDKQKNILHDFSLFEFSDKNLLKREFLAKSIYFNKDEKWLAAEGLSIDNLDNKDFPDIAKVKNFPITLYQTPDDFKQIESDINTLGLRAFYKYIKKLDSSGINTNEYKVIIFEKVNNTILCVIFTLLAATSIFNPSRRNTSFGKTIGFVFIFALLYWLVSSYFYELGKSSKVNSVLASFGVTFLFISYLGSTFYKNRHLGKS